VARAGRLGGLSVAAPALVLIAAGAASGASSVDYTEVPLTQQEIDQNWVTDRSAPSGGHGSVDFAGRTDVLEVRIDPANRSTDSGFYYTEGLKRDVPDVDAARIDLYVDPAWVADGAPDVRAGFWGVGEDADASAAAYPIVEFTTAGDYTGWRVWDSETGWVAHPEIPVGSGWTTLALVLDESADAFDVSIGGHDATSAALGSEALGSVIVNSYNYGPGTAPYEVRWSDFGFGDRVTLASRDQCRDGGWEDFGFTNQGRCVASLVASDHSPH
jgi:hypothetical protein